VRAAIGVGAHFFEQLDAVVLQRIRQREAGQEGAVNAYLTKLTGEVGEKDNQKLQEFKLAFLIAIAEKALAKAKLDGVGKAEGLADQSFERTLGQKLLQQKMDNTESAGLSVTPRRFVELNPTNNTAAFYHLLAAKVAELSASNDPQAINTVIELIAARADVKTHFDKESLETKFDAETVRDVLEAG